MMAVMIALMLRIKISTFVISSSINLIFLLYRSMIKKTIIIPEMIMLMCGIALAKSFLMNPIPLFPTVITDLLIPDVQNITGLAASVIRLIGDPIHKCHHRRLTPIHIVGNFAAQIGKYSGKIHQRYAVGIPRLPAVNSYETVVPGFKISHRRPGIGTGNIAFDFRQGLPIVSQQ
jgi:hypothetical protein